MDDDDFLSDILLRLPPLPSSLPHASLVCKRWRRLVSDPHFLRRFREHHRKPPILGFFSQRVKVEFTSALDFPDSIPPSRFSLRLDDSKRCEIFDCRHGRVLFLNRELHYFVVWAPVTGEQRRVDFPRFFSFHGKHRKWATTGAVVCAAREQGHMHGGCQSNPFQVVVIGIGSNMIGIFACVYSPETCEWGNTISLLLPRDMSDVSLDCPNTVVGNSVFWFLCGRRFGILKFDLCMQSLAAIELPSSAVDYDAICRAEGQFLITPADGGALSFLYLSSFSTQVWKWKASSDGGGGWMLGSKVDLTRLLSLKAGVDTRSPEILGMAEDDNTMILSTDAGLFVLHIESMQFKKLPIKIKLSDGPRIHYAFRSFYPAGHTSDATHTISTLSATGSTKRTITSVIRSQRSASGIGRNSENPVLNRAGPSTVKGHIGHFSTHYAELDTEHIRSSGDDCVNLIPHMFEPEIPTSIRGVQGAHSERSKSKIPAEYANSSSSTIRPTQGAEKTECTVVRKKQHEPMQEFSVANSINAMLHIIDLSDEEKVLSCDLFRDATNREIFLSLDGTLRTTWLKKQLTKFC